MLTTSTCLISSTGRVVGSALGRMNGLVPSRAARCRAAGNPAAPASCPNDGTVNRQQITSGRSPRRSIEVRIERNLLPLIFTRK